MATIITGKTQAEVDAAALVAKQALADAQRRAAYIAESDPLFFKAQRGEASLDEWKAKVVEIKARIPDPA